MRRLSLAATPSRRKQQQKKRLPQQQLQQLQQQERVRVRSSCSKSTNKSMDSQRSTCGNLSMLSSVSASQSSDSLTSLSTATSSCSGVMGDYDDDADEQLEASECCEQGWMYWKKSDDCWLKMYARLRNEVLWLSKGPVGNAMAVVQIAVAGVRATDIGGIIARGPAGESMELFAYDRERTDDWVDALFVAAQLTQSYERSVATEGSLIHVSSRRGVKGLDQVYSGTLVTYNKEQEKSPWKQRLRNTCRRQLEKFVDRLDTTKR
ncbi:unnamed protein product [Hyaloperonospora brassicae]|uniref:PH domain-containing protein n=1 Tax=Hyaloperonospora brassicae TaxID=162125 RepID=A0AAV0TGJ3_HYABA|nr:unnamed protein product [Hyaloperonospora brassicae]